MELNLPTHPDTPLYRRIAEAITAQVVAGQYIPGQKLPAHLGLARSLKVSPLTVSKAYEWLTQQGIVRQRRGSGTFVAADALTRLQQPTATSSAGRSIRALHLVVGQSHLAACRRETFFIIANKLEGIQSVLPASQTTIHCVPSLTRAALPVVNDDEAVLILAPRELDDAYASELKARNIPMLMVGTDGLASDTPVLQYDRQQAIALACDHLIGLGFERIGFLGRKHLNQQHRVQGKFALFMSQLHEAGLDVCARYTRDVDVAPGKAYAAAMDIIRSGDLPEAFFVDTDYKAMETICALTDAGLRVPEDVAIVSYDDVPEAGGFTPALTTVRTPHREMGVTAARLLVNWPATRELENLSPLPCQLMVRQSCGSGLVGNAVSDESQKLSNTQATSSSLPSRTEPRGGPG